MKVLIPSPLRSYTGERHEVHELALRDDLALAVLVEAGHPQRVADQFARDFDVDAHPGVARDDVGDRRRRDYIRTKAGTIADGRPREHRERLDRSHQSEVREPVAEEGERRAVVGHVRDRGG